MKEKWKDIPGYEGFYQASTLGRIKSLSRKHAPREMILKPGKHRAGYGLVSLNIRRNRKMFAVHQLIAKTFIGPTDGFEVNHKNSIKTDDRLKNLEVITQQQNARHALENGFAGTKLSFKKANDIRRRYAYGGITQKRLAWRYGVTDANISYIVNNKTWIQPTQAKA